MNTKELIEGYVNRNIRTLENSRVFGELIEECFDSSGLIFRKMKIKSKGLKSSSVFKLLDTLLSRGHGFSFEEKKFNRLTVEASQMTEQLRKSKRTVKELTDRVEALQGELRRERRSARSSRESFEREKREARIKDEALLFTMLNAMNTFNSEYMERILKSTLITPSEPKGGYGYPRPVPRGGQPSTQPWNEPRQPVLDYNDFSLTLTSSSAETVDYDSRAIFSVSVKYTQGMDFNDWTSVQVQHDAKTVSIFDSQFEVECKKIGRNRVCVTYKNQTKELFFTVREPKPIFRIELESEFQNCEIGEDVQNRVRVECDNLVPGMTKPVIEWNRVEILVNSVRIYCNSEGGGSFRFKTKDVATHSVSFRYENASLSKSFEVSDLVIDVDKSEMKVQKYVKRIFQYFSDDVPDFTRLEKEGNPKEVCATDLVFFTMKLISTSGKQIQDIKGGKIVMRGMKIELGATSSSLLTLSSNRTITHEFPLKYEMTRKVWHTDKVALTELEGALHVHLSTAPNLRCKLKVRNEPLDVLICGGAYKMKNLPTLLQTELGKSGVNSRVSAQDYKQVERSLSLEKMDKNPDLFIYIPKDSCPQPMPKEIVGKRMKHLVKLSKYSSAIYVHAVSQVMTYATHMQKKGTEKHEYELQKIKVKYRDFQSGVLFNTRKEHKDDFAIPYDLREYLVKDTEPMYTKQMKDLVECIKKVVEFKKNNPKSYD